ncbi:MAG: succinate dehydrogenase iron-sulfur subunit [Clostridia bacterium]|nr:MAG: succinate dehydrogenase iron-sulfur subunit [Clostridia bacterium]
MTFKVQRFDPERDQGPYLKEYHVPYTQGLTVLDGLYYIKEKLDGSLAFRASCRMAVCGSCGMFINGKPHLACHTQITELESTVLEIRPLPNYSVIKDLVCDFTPLFAKHKAIKPYIIRREAGEIDNPTREFLQSPAELESYLQFSYCMKCGLCLAACPTAATDRNFLGPQALGQAYRYCADSRDDGLAERVKEIDHAHGVWRCHLAGACSEACPKGVDPALGIQLLKRQVVLRAVGLGKGRKLAAVVPPPSGQAKPRVEAPPFTVPRAKAEIAAGDSRS